jgi:signal transduction histidine kinase
MTDILIGQLVGDEGITEEQSLLTVRVLKHELRTPINHIIGYCELLAEDLADQPVPDERRMVDATLTIGKELLAFINSTLGSAIGPDEVAPADLLGTLRTGVQLRVDRILATGLASSTLAQSPSSGDVLKILDGATRLAGFARTGKIRNRESDEP